MKCYEKDEDQFNELHFYTLSLGNPAFIRQNIVDAYKAQTADSATKPISSFLHWSDSISM